MRSNQVSAETLQICFVSDQVGSASTLWWLATRWKKELVLGRSSSTPWCICALSSIFTKIHSHAFTSVHAQVCMFISRPQSQMRAVSFKHSLGIQLPTHHTAVPQMLAYLFVLCMSIYICYIHHSEMEAMKVARTLSIPVTHLSNISVFRKSWMVKFLLGDAGENVPSIYRFLEMSDSWKETAVRLQSAQSRM